MRNYLPVISSTHQLNFGNPIVEKRPGYYGAIPQAIITDVPEI